MFRRRRVDSKRNTPSNPVTVPIKVEKHYHMRYLVLFFLIILYFHPWTNKKWKIPETVEIAYWWEITKQTFLN